MQHYTNRILVLYVQKNNLKFRESTHNAVNLSA